MGCHRKLAPLLTFILFILLHSCHQSVLVNSAVDGIFCEILNVSVAQRWIGNALLVTEESRSIQNNLASSVDLASPNSEHWSCFETETTTGILGTPGGDFSEFLLGLTVLFKDSPLLQYNSTTTPTIQPTTTTTASPTYQTQSSSPVPIANETSPLPVQSTSSSNSLATSSSSSSSSSSGETETQTSLATLNVTTTYFPAPQQTENSTSTDSDQTTVSPQQTSNSTNNNNIIDTIKSVASQIKSNLTDATDSTSTTTASSSTINSNVTASLNATSSNRTISGTTLPLSRTQAASNSASPSSSVTSSRPYSPPVVNGTNPILNPPLFKRVHDIFHDFIRVNVSALRRFYYHSDYDIVERMRKEVDVRNGDLFYDQQTPEQQSKSLSLVIQPENIGCRHLRLALEHPELYQTPTILTQTFLQVLHDYLWNYNNGTFLSRFYIDLAKRTHPKEFAHLNVSINVEDHSDEANEYDQTEGTNNPCFRLQPAVPTLIGNQSYFVVQQKGIAYFRQELADYMASLPEAKVKDSKEFYKQIDELAGKQWALSQSNLGPDLKTFDVVVFTRNRTSEVVEQTWLFIGVGVIAAAILSYLLWIYWKKRRQQQQEPRLFDVESPNPADTNLSSPGEKLPFNNQNPTTYSK